MERGRKGYLGRSEPLSKVSSPVLPGTKTATTFACRQEVVLLEEKGNNWLWPEYYQEYPVFSKQTVRPGCYPRKLVHPDRRENGIVLVHGLTDSPYYMQAIAEYFYTFLGYNVYIPLLQCHGLQEPNGMEGVSLHEWEQNVQFAIRTANEHADRISIGGLSTGGALSFYLACTEPKVTGDLYLFSAALGLYGCGFELLSRLVEFLLRIPLFHLFDNRKPLVGKLPYRYDRVPLNSAGELAKLILKIDQLLADPGGCTGSKRIFAAWSESDRVINIQKIKKLGTLSWVERFEPFSLAKDVGVEHACVVLAETVYAAEGKSADVPLEEANPLFDKMMAAIADFAAT